MFRLFCFGLFVLTFAFNGLNYSRLHSLNNQFNVFVLYEIPFGFICGGRCCCSCLHIQFFVLFRSQLYVVRGNYWALCVERNREVSNSNLVVAKTTVFFFNGFDEKLCVCVVLNRAGLLFAGCSLYVKCSNFKPNYAV